MQIVATSSDGLTVAYDEKRGKCFDYFGVPSHIQEQAKHICNNGGQAWNLLAPYAQADVREHYRLKQTRQGDN